MGPPTDPGPSGSARVSKWSVHLCLQHQSPACTNFCNALQPNCRVILYHVIWCRQMHCICTLHLGCH
ncbi:unnamed protein product [Staurois parvus]|uniref:Uncharacterized protein n=1 Tax=Staurois parvus TaxID=386267 RepID=A0ABN9FBS9_9NEOB|nr:unnamed protein product [Staurois parvus]